MPKPTPRLLRHSQGQSGRRTRFQAHHGRGSHEHQKWWLPIGERKPREPQQPHSAEQQSVGTSDRWRLRFLHSPLRRGLPGDRFLRFRRSPLRRGSHQDRISRFLSSSLRRELDRYSSLFRRRQQRLLWVLRLYWRICKDSSSQRLMRHWPGLRRPAPDSNKL